MAKSSTNFTRLTERKWIERDFKEHHFLGIRWHERLSEHSLGSDLVIETNGKYNNIIFNGKKIELDRNGESVK